ncbi:TonB-dependent receptor plug domain-containing protein [Sphingobacterium detergens]
MNNDNVITKGKKLDKRSVPETISGLSKKEKFFNKKKHSGPFLNSFFTIIYVLCTTLAFSQVEVIRDKINEYADLLPLERVYAHTNKTIFAPEETIYFTTYLCNTAFGVSNQSDIVLVDLIAPNGQVIQHRQFAANTIYAKGSLQLGGQLAGGIYKLKVQTPWMINFPNLAYEKDITIMRTNPPRLIMQLELEKESYGKGETVAADFVVKDLGNHPLSNQSFVYEVSIGGELYLSQDSKTDHLGKSQVTFALPAILKDKHVSLNVRFVHQQQIESISKSVPIILDDIDVQFMPEGGYLLGKFSNVVAFKALNAEGFPADIEGTIYDDRGNEISKFSSFHQGMGKFSFIPKQGRAYYAQLEKPYRANKQITLPTMKPDGIKVQLDEQSKNELSLQVISSMDSRVSYLIRKEDKIFHTGELAVTKGINSLKVSKEALPQGVLSISILQGRQILSERLFFNAINDGLQIHVTSDKAIYKTREDVKLTIETRDARGEAVPAAISLSVVDDKILSYLNDKQHDLLSWMWLGTAVQGDIYQPAFYFDPTKDKRTQALDILMLTQGWRNYKWDKVLSNDELTVVKTPPNNLLRGVVYRQGKGRNTVYSSKMYVVADSLLYTVTPDKQGRFSVRTIPCALWRIYIPTHRKNEFYYVTASRNEDLASVREKRRATVPVLVKFETTPLIQRVNDETPLPPKIEMEPQASNRDGVLEEVVVLGYDVDRKRSLTGSVVTISGNDLYAQADLISTLSGKLAGVSVSPSVERSNAPVVIRGMNSIGGTGGPLFVVDGVPYNEANMANFTGFPPELIQSISILKDASATAIYGVRGANGVILITTKGGKGMEGDAASFLGNSHLVGPQEYLTLNTVSPKVRFDQPQEFYVPKYQNKQALIKDDFRDNIYWNYHIETNAQGRALVTFPNADENTSYRVIVEGIGKNGMIGRSQQTTYQVRDEIGLDVKLPLYASQGDLINAQLLVDNTRRQPVSIRSQVDLVGDNLEWKSEGSNLKIGAQEQSQVRVPLEVKRPSIDRDKIRFSIRTDSSAQGIIKDIKLFNKGFPVAFGHSTSKYVEHEFELKNAVKGSQQLSVELYLNPLKQITQGLERIVREPHGCFEQVSSSVYPNIYALSLMRQIRTDEFLQRKTKEFLENGYKKLAAYEIKGGGFDWYGKPPAHEVLSAFGLIEFIEMKPFIAVDQKMIERTKNWLLSKKDGRGGYHQAKGRYAFSGNRELINNTYITYALSVAGLREEIENEFQKAYQEVLRSKDPYRMALVALTASNLNKLEQLENLKLQLKELLPSVVEGKKELVEGSITNSDGRSLRNETLAWIALVFQLDKKPSNELTLCMEALVKFADKGYYGSTQATGLALKAATGYYQLFDQDMKTKKGKKIELWVDGEILLRDTTPQADSLSKLFSLELPAGKHKISLRLENLDYAVASYRFNYLTLESPSAKDRTLDLSTSLSSNRVRLGDNTVLKVRLNNKRGRAQAMPLAKVGIPGGLTPEPQQLRDLMEKGFVDYYEIFENYLVFYWRGIDAKETKELSIDLKAQVPGRYQGAASSGYLYYTEELKDWQEGLKVEIE